MKAEQIQFHGFLPSI